MVHKTFPGIMWGPTKNLGPNGLTVLTFGYKETDKQSIYINIMYSYIRGGRKLYKGWTCYCEGWRGVRERGRGGERGRGRGLNWGKTGRDYWGQGIRPVTHELGEGKCELRKRDTKKYMWERERERFSINVKTLYNFAPYFTLLKVIIEQWIQG